MHIDAAGQAPKGKPVACLELLGTQSSLAVFFCLAASFCLLLCFPLGRLLPTSPFFISFLGTCGDLKPARPCEHNPGRAVAALQDGRPHGESCSPQLTSVHAFQVLVWHAPSPCGRLTDALWQGAGACLNRQGL